jgi:hypothetical protein
MNFIRSTSAFSVSDGVANKISAFRNLRAGWKLGGGAPITDAAYSTALKLNYFAPPSEKKDVFPNEDGGLELAIYKDELRYGFSISPSGKISLSKETEDEVVTEEISGFSSAATKLTQISGTWNTYAIYTSQITSPKNVGLEVRALIPQAMVAAFQSLAPRAPLQYPETPVTMGDHSIPALKVGGDRSLPNRPYSSPLSQTIVFQAA